MDKQWQRAERRSIINIDESEILPLEHRCVLVDRHTWRQGDTIEMTVNAKDPTLNLVSSAYGVAIRPERFDDYLEAWDEWFEALIEDTEAAFAKVSPMINDALAQSDHLQTTMPEKPLERVLVPLVLLDATGDILALNAAARNLFSEQELDPVQVLSKRTPIQDAEHGTKHDLFRMGGGALPHSFLAIETEVKAAMAIEYPNADKALYLSLMDWNTEFSRNLGQRFDLTDAELRVVRGLFEGRTAQQISGDLNRSIATIRSHIKSLLHKTGTNRQGELVQFLSILRQVVDDAPRSASARVSADFDVVELSGPAGKLQVVRYGHGQPLLYFTTSSCPEETSAFRKALVQEGFAVTAPVRPGFRSSDLNGPDATDALLDDWLTQLIAVAGAKPLVVGHREGGIVAARAVQWMAARKEPVAGLALLSTGAPVRSLSQFDNTPASIRRSFFGAQMAAPALRLGYMAARRLYNSSKAGQDQIIRFFHKDSPRDREMLADPVYYEITRDLLTFCFENTDQIVRDVALWGSDWSTTLQAASDIAPVLFVHGNDHAFHPLRDIERLVQDQKSIACLPIDQSGQLAIYEHPGVIAKALSEFMQPTF